MPCPIHGSSGQMGITRSVWAQWVQHDHRVWSPTSSQRKTGYARGDGRISAGVSGEFEMNKPPFQNRRRRGPCETGRWKGSRCKKNSDGCGVLVLSKHTISAIGSAHITPRVSSVRFTHKFANSPSFYFIPLFISDTIFFTLQFSKRAPLSIFDTGLCQEEQKRWKYFHQMVKGLHWFGAVWLMLHIHAHSLGPTAIGYHARNQPARQEQLGVRRLAQGHFDTPRVGSNPRPSDCQTTALTNFGRWLHFHPWVTVWFIYQTSEKTSEMYMRYKKRAFIRCVRMVWMCFE